MEGWSDLSNPDIGSPQNNEGCASFPGDYWLSPAFLGITGYLSPAFLGITGYLSPAFLGITGYLSPAFLGITGYHQLSWGLLVITSFPGDYWLSITSFPGDYWLSITSFPGDYWLSPLNTKHPLQLHSPITPGSQHL